MAVVLGPQLEFFRRLVLTAGLALLSFAGHAATNDFFAQGVALSRAGQYPEAATAFANAARIQPSDGALLNLGLAEWQRGHAGAAILAWEQARWLNPFDALAGQDLDFARQLAQVEAPQLKWFETASTWLPPNAWAWLTSTSLWLMVGLLIFPGIFRRRMSGWHQMLAALAFGIFLFSLTATVGIWSRTQIGFVQKKNASLLLTPTRDGETISTLASGEPARQVPDPRQLRVYPHRRQVGMD